MLVLTRRKKESIVIGDDIGVFVINILGDKVKRGITAPKKVPIHRGEVFRSISIEKLKNLEEKSKSGVTGKKTTGKRDKHKPKLPREHSQLENMYHIYSDMQQINYNKFNLNYLS